MTNRIGVVIGDTAGVGAELLAGVLAEEATRHEAELFFVGDRRVLAKGKQTVGVGLDLALDNSPGNHILAGSRCSLSHSSA